jgi:hypothetical protein
MKRNGKIFIPLQTFTNPNISGNDLSIEIFRKFSINIAKTTINNFRKSISLKYSPYIRSIFLTEEAKGKRVNWAQNFLKENLNH